MSLPTIKAIIVILKHSFNDFFVDTTETIKRNWLNVPAKIDYDLENYGQSTSTQRVSENISTIYFSKS